MITRRCAFKYTVIGAAALTLPVSSLKSVQSAEVQRFFLSLEGDAARQLPENKRIPFGWKAFALSPEGKSLLLRPNAAVDNQYAEYRLRLATAVDMREEKLVQVRIANSQRIVGELDIRYSPVLHLYELAIPSEYIELITKYGIELKVVKGKQPAWFFSSTSYDSDSKNTFLPQIVAIPSQPPEPTEAFLSQLMSLNTLQPFGWMEGCVLDGLWQLYQRKDLEKAKTTIENHLAKFFDAQGNFVHEDPRSTPHDNRISGIESTLPFAVLSSLYPDHPLLEKVLDFWQSHRKESGIVVDNSMVSAEGNYTIAYPMAVLADQRGDTALMELATLQFQLRRKLLTDQQGNYYLRYHPDTQAHSFRFWARGLAWYMLGLARALPLAENYVSTEDLKEEFNRIAETVVSYQRPDGLWHCFIDHSSVAVDTSGSAGIAAALASGATDNLLDRSFLDAATKTWQGLQSYITPDGFLTGGAQSNRGGLALQESNYRVITQMGMGLMGQLYACIE